MKRTIASLGALGCAALLITGVVGADSDARSEPRVEFGPWSAPVNLGAVVNSTFVEAAPAISKDGLSLYLHSSRQPATLNDLYVSRRAAIDLPWEMPVNLGVIVNSSSPDAGPTLSKNGHYLFFGSLRTGDFDIYVSRRRHTHDDFAWEAPVALSAPVNGPSFDVPFDYFENPNGRPQLYFGSDRASGGGALGLDIYVSELKKDGAWGDPVFVSELNSEFQEGRVAIRADGLEIIFGSTRDGNEDLYVARRNHVWEVWSTPETLGPTVNTASGEIQPALSANGGTLYFASTRLGSFDLYACTRSRLRPRD
jgi:Tol biopolymer transport system component